MKLAGVVRKWVELTPPSRGCRKLPDYRQLQFAVMLLSTDLLLPMTVKLLLQVFMVMCVWSCSPLMAENTANYNCSHCDVVDDIDTHDESDESLSFSTPPLPSTVPSSTQVIDDVPTGPRNVCPTVSAITPCLSLLNTQHHSSPLDLVLVLACTFVVFILNYLFFCFLLSLIGLRVIAKFSIELD